VADDEILWDLLVLANRYGSGYLEELLINAIGCGIDENNCCELWSLSENYGFHKLQNMCKDYFLRNIDEVLRSKAFEHLTTEKKCEITALSNRNSLFSPDVQALQKKKREYEEDKN